MRAASYRRLARAAIVGLAAALVIGSCAMLPARPEQRNVQFDGSYWGSPVLEVQGDLDDPYDHGTMTLSGRDAAMYVSDGGARIRFERLPAKPTFEPCA